MFSALVGDRKGILPQNSAPLASWNVLSLHFSFFAAGSVILSEKDIGGWC